MFVCLFVKGKRGERAGRERARERGKEREREKKKRKRILWGRHVNSLPASDSNFMVFFSTLLLIVDYVAVATA